MCRKTRPRCHPVRHIPRAWCTAASASIRVGKSIPDLNREFISSNTSSERPGAVTDVKPSRSFVLESVELEGFVLGERRGWVPDEPLRRPTSWSSPFICGDSMGWRPTSMSGVVTGGWGPGIERGHTASRKFSFSFCILLYSYIFTFPISLPPHIFDRSAEYVL